MIWCNNYQHTLDMIRMQGTDTISTTPAHLKA